MLHHNSIVVVSMVVLDETYHVVGSIDILYYYIIPKECLYILFDNICIPKDDNEMTIYRHHKAKRSLAQSSMGFIDIDAA